MEKSKFLNRWHKLSLTTKRDICPSGDGLLPVKKIVLDSSGQIHEIITGYDNIQERMNKENKETDLRSLLAEVQAGNRKRVEGISNASSLPKSRYDLLKRTEALVNYWDKNPLLRMVYKNKEELLSDLNKKDGAKLVLDKTTKFGQSLLKPLKENTEEIKVPETTKKDVAPVSAPKENINEVK